MARIRTIKPEFWTAEQVMECSPNARLAFIGLWNFCDDAGIHPASAKTLKAEVFPSDDITSLDVERMVDELVTQGLLEVYEVEGRKYWAVTGWHHQKIDQPTYKHPRPDGTTPPGAARRRSEKKKGEQAPDVRGLFDEHSPNASGVFTPGRESSGREGKGVNPGCEPVAWTETEEGASTAPAGCATSPIPESAPETPAPSSPPQTTRKGLVCRMLREVCGVADAAPHHLTEEVWEKILSQRTDEEIREFALAKVADRPGQRTGLKYLAPGLLDQPASLATIPRARGAPPGSKSQALAEHNRRACEQAEAEILAREAARQTAGAHDGTR